jgi:hypothetical protein
MSAFGGKADTYSNWTKKFPNRFTAVGAALDNCIGYLDEVVGTRQPPAIEISREFGVPSGGSGPSLLMSTIESWHPIAEQLFDVIRLLFEETNASSQAR